MRRVKNGLLTYDKSILLPIKKESIKRGWQSLLNTKPPEKAKKMELVIDYLLLMADRNGVVPGTIEDILQGIDKPGKLSVTDVKYCLSKLMEAGIITRKPGVTFIKEMESD